MEYAERSARGLFTPINVAVLLISFGVAAVVPFDRAILSLTDGRWIARALALAGLALIGIAVAPSLGMSIAQHDLRRPVLSAVFIAIGTAAFCAFLDVVLFRSVLLRGYVDNAQHVSTGTRVLNYALQSLGEGILYQLFLGSVLASAFALIWRAEGPAIMAGMTLAMVVNIALNVWMTPGNPPTILAVVYWAVRFVSPGVLWGYLYWKHGFLTAEISRATTHFFLQPLLTLGLA